MTTPPETATVRITGFGPPEVIALDFDLDRTPFRVELPQPYGMDAAGWAACDDWLAVMPGALDEDQGAYWRERLDDPVDPLTGAALRAVTYGLAPQLYGMEWWAAHRLCARAAAQWWQYEAWTVSKAFDPRTASAARIAASCWAWAVAGCEKDEEVQALHRDVFNAPPGAAVAGDAHLARGRAMLARHLPAQTG